MLKAHPEIKLTLEDVHAYQPKGELTDGDALTLEVTNINELRDRLIDHAGANLLDEESERSVCNVRHDVRSSGQRLAALMQEAEEDSAAEDGLDHFARAFRREREVQKAARDYAFVKQFSAWDYIGELYGKAVTDPGVQDEFVEVSYLHHALHALATEIRPTEGRGPQDGNAHALAILAEVTTGIAKKQLARFDEWDDED